MRWTFIGNTIVNRRGGQAWSSYWATRTPSTLALTNVGYPEGIELNWVNAGTGYDGTSIERSTDGVTYAEIDTVASGVLTYQDLTAVFGSTYYYRVRCYKGTNYSPYSNAESLEVTSDRFMITVDTTKAGSADTHFVLPVTAKSASDYYVDWGDGGAEETFTTTGNKDHTYASSGTYQVKVRGGMTALTFNNAGDCAKLIYIDNWGNIAWSSMAYAFYGCSNMDCNATDSADTSLVESFSSAFRDCSSLKTLDTSGWDTGAVTSFNSMFRGCSSLTTLDTSGWNTVKVTSFASAFRDCFLLKGDFSDIVLTAATSLASMFSGCNINATGTTTNYDATLVAWATADVPDALSFHGGYSKYGDGLVDSGTTDGDAAGKLIQSGQNFSATVTVGDVIYNITDGTYARVTNIDSDTQLTLDTDIMDNGENYRVQHGAGAIARASLILDDSWTITDGGYA